MVLETNAELRTSEPTGRFRINLCTSLAELKSLNDKLSDIAFYDQVHGFIKSIGGYNAGDCIRCILKRLLTDKVMMEINMKGGKNRQTENQKIKFEDTSLCNVILESLREMYPGIASNAFKTDMGKYFQNARKRFLSKEN